MVLETMRLHENSIEQRKNLWDNAAPSVAHTVQKFKFMVQFWTGYCTTAKHNLKMYFYMLASSSAPLLLCSTATSLTAMPYFTSQTHFVAHNKVIIVHLWNCSNEVEQSVSRIQPCWWGWFLRVCLMVFLEFCDTSKSSVQVSNETRSLQCWLQSFVK